MFKSWAELSTFFDDGDQIVLNKMATFDLPIPEYLETAIKKSDEGNDILMSWPSKDVLICQQDTSDRTIDYFESKGWRAYRFYDIDFDKLKGELN